MSVREEGPLLKPLTRERVPKSEPTAINSSGSEGTRNETNISQTPTLNPNPLFRNGMPLPKEIKTQLTNALVHRPLEEIDPFYSKRNTFVVIGNQRIYRFSRNLTLLTLSPFNAFRRFSIFLLTHWFFSVFLVAVVLLNCFFALRSTSTNNAVFFISECVFLSIYTTELLITVVGRGLFLVPFSCLRMPWNIFNLFLIANGWLYLKYSFWIYKIAYALRIFKVIPYISGLQLCFEFILGVIRRLRSTVISSGLLSVLFSTIGIHLFKGNLKQRCIPNINATQTNYAADAILQDHSGSLCGNYSTTSHCEEGYICLMDNTNPNYGYTSFDSFPQALLQIFRLIMQDYPDDLYHKIWATTGSWHVIYFAGIFLLGTFVLKTYVMTITARAIIEETNILFVEKEESLPLRPGRYLDILCGWNCSETFKVVRETVKKFMDHGLTQFFICTVILIDTFSMASYFYGIEDMNPVMYVISYYVCKICFAVYIVELILQIFSLSPLHYFRNYWNIFDFIIIVMYAVNRIIKKNWVEETVLDILLVARMFKLGSRWTTLELQIIILMKVIWKYLSHFVITLLSIYAFGLLGVLLYKETIYDSDDSYKFDDGKPIWNFSSFISSFMISFRILCGEWIESLWDCLHQTGNSCFVYFFSAVIILNMFLTILSVSTIFTTFKVLKMQENDIFASENSNKSVSLRQKFVTIFNTVKSKIAKQFSNKTAVEVDGEVPTEVQLSQNIQQETRSNESRQNKCKQLVAAVHQNKFIKLLSIFVITVSSIALIPNDIQHGYHPKSLQIVLYTIEIVFTVYFLIDIILAVISLGFLKSICTLNWLFDTVIITEMIFNLALLDFHSSTFKSYGILSLRCLRPLMLISRVQRLKAVFTGLTRQLSFLMKFLIVAAFVWMYFAIQGVHIYGGLFYSCLEWEETDYKVAPFAKHECLAANLTWINAAHNFDDLKSSFLSIALITTRNGWRSILVDALTAHKEFERGFPIENITINVYIIAVIIFGAFFTCNILFGAMIFHIKNNKEIFMTFDQVEEYNKKKSGKSSATVIEKPTLVPFKCIHDLVFSPIFDGLVMAVILVDILALAGSSLTASDRILSLLGQIFSTVTFLYTVELILKLIAWKHHFLKNSLNIFDLIIVLFSISIYLIDNITYAEVVAVIRTLRILRILHFKPFLRRAPMISTFLLGLYRIYPILLNLIYMLVLLMFTFGLIGMSHFKNVKTEETLPEMINFKTFSRTILTIFQLTTFSGWDTILDDAIGNEYDCNPPHCGNLTLASLFLITYLFIVFIMVTNLYALLVLEILNCFDDTKESLAEASNPNLTSESPNIVETINLNPSCSVSVRRKSVACFVIENTNDNNREAQIVILPQETVQVVFRSAPN